MITTLERSVLGAWLACAVAACSNASSPPSNDAGASGVTSASAGTPSSAGTTGNAAGGSGTLGSSGALGGGAGGQSDAAQGGLAGAGTGISGAATTADGGASGGSGGAGGQPAAGSAGASPTQTGGAAGAPAGSLESIPVPNNGSTAMSQTTLTTGDLFLLKASGQAVLGSGWVDAEYGATGANGTGDDLLAGTDVGVDVGFKVERVAKGATASRKKWFGDFRSDHTYYLLVTGAGAPLSVKLLLPAGGMASPSSDGITVSLIRLSPMAPPLSPRDSIKVPIIKQIVSSTFVPTTGSVYLLQAAGSGKAGGANLGLGDADWMDWNADGVGKLDIGDNNVDYGIGVDESNTAQTPRQRWWGPWRKDHIYYQLFAGTGKPIQFMYYDSGYGDNSATAQLTVQIFPVP